jgi:hypothetical protein
LLSEAVGKAGTGRLSIFIFVFAVEAIGRFYGADII